MEFEIGKLNTAGDRIYCSFYFSAEHWEECLGYVLVVIVTELTSWQDFVIKIGLKKMPITRFNLFPVRYQRKIILQIASITSVIMVICKLY